jgi:adenylosuccinate lyase
LDYALNEMTDILANLVVFDDQMRYNLDSSGGLVFSQQVMLKLVEVGFDRQAAYKIVQKHAMKAWRERGSFIENLKTDPQVVAHLNEEQLKAIFDYNYHFKYIETAYKRLNLNDS